MARNKKIPRRKQRRAQHCAQSVAPARHPGRTPRRAGSLTSARAFLLALLLVFFTSAGAQADQEIGGSSTWNVGGASGQTTYSSGSTTLVTTSGSNTGLALTSLVINVGTNENPRQLVVTGNLLFTGGVTLNGQEVFGVPHYAELTVNNGVTVTAQTGTTITSYTKLDINGTYVSNVTVQGVDAHVNLGGVLQGALTVYGFDPVSTTLTTTADTARITGDLNLRQGTVSVSGGNLRVDGNTTLYGKTGESTLNITNGKQLNLYGNLQVGNSAFYGTPSDRTGIITVDNGGALNMQAGSTVHLYGESAGAPATLQVLGGSTGATANLGTLNVGGGGFYGSLLIDGGTAPAGSTKVTVQNLTIDAASSGEVRSNGVLEIATSGVNLNGIAGPLNVHSNGQVLTHAATITDSHLTGQGGTGISLWDGGTLTNTGTLTVTPAGANVVLATQGVINTQILKAGATGTAGLTLNATSGTQVVNLSGDGTTFLQAGSLTINANNTLNVAGSGGSFAGGVTVNGGSLGLGTGTWNFTNAAGLALSAGSLDVGNGSTLNVAQLGLSGTGVTNVLTGGTLHDSGAMTVANQSQLNVNGGTVTSTGAATTSGTSAVVISNNGSFTAPTLNAGSTGGVTLNSGTLNVGTATNATATGAVAINGGTATLSAASSTAAQGITVNGGSVTANTVTSSTATGGVTVTAGQLEVASNINVGSAAGGLTITGGKVILDPAGTVTATNTGTQGTIVVNGTLATLQGAWGTLIHNNAGTLDKQNAFLNMVKGTLLLTGKTTYTLDDLQAARTAYNGTMLGSQVLITSQGSFTTAGGTNITSIRVDDPNLPIINGGLFGTDLTQTSPTTAIVIAGTGLPGGGQNIGFKDVDLGQKPLTVTNASSLTVVGSLTNGDPLKPIVLDNGTLNLGSVGTPSGGTVSTGVTTTATANNALNLGNGTYTVAGDITHNAGGQLAMDVEHGTLTAPNVDTTTLKVTNGGTLHATGTLNVGNLTDGVTPGVIDNGHVQADGNMTVTTGGVDAINGATVNVAGTLATGTGNITAESGSNVNAHVLTGTGNILSTGTGSHVGVDTAYTATGTVTAQNGGGVTMGSDLTLTQALLVDGAGSTLNVTGNLIAGGKDITASNGGAATVGSVVNGGAITASGNGSLTSNGPVSSTGILTAQSGGDIAVTGPLNNTGLILITGLGSTLNVSGALTTPSGLQATAGGTATLGSIAQGGNIKVDGADSSITSTGNVTNSGMTKADNGGLFTVGGNLNTTGNVYADGNGTLTVAGTLTTPADAYATFGGTITGTTAINARSVTAHEGSVFTGGLLTTTGGVSGTGATATISAASGANIGGVLSIDTDAQGVFGGPVTAHGVSVATGGDVVITGSLDTVGAPVAVTDAGSTLTVHGVLHANNQNLSVLGGAQATIDGLTLGADITVSGNDGATPSTPSTLTAHGDVTNAGTTTVDGGHVVLDNNGKLTTTGPLVVSHDGLVQTAGNSSAGAVTISTGGDVAVTGTLTSTGAVSVDGVGSTLTTTGALTAAGQDVSVTNGATATLGGVTAAKNVNVTGTGSLATVHGDVVNSGNTLADGGHLVLDTGGRLVTTGSLVATNNGLVQAAGNSSAASVTASLGGDIAVTGSLTSTGPVSVTGTGSTLTATGALTATNQNLAVSSGGVATLGSIAAAGDITASGTGSLITVHGNAVNSGNTLADGGHIVLDTAGGLTTTGSITATNNGLVQTAGNTSAASVTANLGGDIAVTGNLASTGAVNVTGVGSTLSTTGSLTATNQNLSVTAGGVATLGSMAAANDITASGTGSLITVHGNAVNSGNTLADGGHIVLDTAGGLTTTGSITATNNGLVQTAGNTSAASVTASLGGDIAVTGNLTSTGLLPGGVSVSGAGSTLTATGALTATGQDLTVTGGAQATLGSVTAANTISVTGNDGGSPATTSNLTVHGNVTNGGNTLADGGHLIIDNGGSLTTTGSLTATNAGLVQVQGAASAASITASADGDVLVTGALTSTGPVNITGAGSHVSAFSLLSSGPVGVNGTGALLTTIGAVSLAGQDLSVTGGATGDIGSVTAARNVNVTGSGSALTVHGDVTNTGTTTVDAGSLILDSGGGLHSAGLVTATNNGQITVAGNSSAGGLTASTGGDVIITGNLTSTGTVNVTGTGSTLTLNGALAAASNNLRVTGGGVATLGSVTAAQDVTVTGATSVLTVHGDVVNSGNVLVNTGRMTLDNGSGGGSLHTTGTIAVVDSGILTVTGPLNLTNQMLIDNGAVTSGVITTSVNGANTGAITVNNGGVLTASTLNAGTTGALTLNAGTVNLTTTNASASNAVTVNGGTAHLGAVNSTASNAVNLTSGTTTMGTVTSSAAQGLNVSGGTSTATSLASSTLGGVTVSGGQLTVNGTVNVGTTSGAVQVTGGTLVLGSGTTVTADATTPGSIKVNGASATLQGDWAALIDKAAGNYDRQKALLDITRGTLLLTGEGTYTLADLAAARTTSGGATLGSQVMISSLGVLVNGGTPVASIFVDDPLLPQLNVGLFGTDLAQTTPTPTAIVIAGTGLPGGGQHVGFKDVDLGQLPMNIGNDSGLTVVGSITNGDPTKPIILDNGSLTLGVDGVTSGGTVATGITTAAGTNNALTLGNGNYTVAGDITLDGATPTATLALTVDKGTLTAPNVQATTVDVGTGGTLHTTGNLVAGSLTDGVTPGTIDNGHVVADGNMTLATGGINAVNGATVDVTGTLNIGANPIAASGTGSRVHVQSPFTSTGTITASAGGTVGFGNSLNSDKAVTADGGTVSTGGNMTLTAAAPLLADHGGTVTVGGALNSNGPVTADHGSSIGITGAASTGALTALHGSDISVGGNATATGTVSAAGTNSDISVAGALNAPGQDVIATGGAAITLGSVTAAKDVTASGNTGGVGATPSTVTVHGNVNNSGNILADGGKIIVDNNGNLTSAGSLTATNDGLVQTAGNASAAGVTASLGGDVSVGGNLTSTAPVAVSGTGSTLTVTGAVTATGTDISVTGGAQSTLGSVASARDITVSGSGGTPLVPSNLLVHGDVTNTGNTLVSGGHMTLDNGSGGGSLHTTGTITVNNSGVLDTAGALNLTNGLIINNGSVAIGATGAITTAVNGANHGNITVSNGGSLTAPTLNAATTGALTLQGGSVTLTNTNASVANAVTVNGGVANLGAVNSTASNAVTLNAGTVHTGAVTSSAAQGFVVNGSGTTVTATSLASTATGGVTVNDGLLSVNGNVNLGSTASAVEVTGGKLVLGSGATVTSTGGTINVNGANATLQGAWGTLIQKAGGNYDRQQAFVDMTRGTLLLTGEQYYTLADLVAARKTAAGTSLGAQVLIASQGTLTAGGAPVTSISVDDPLLNTLNGGLLGTDLVQTSPTTTAVVIDGTGLPGGGQNVGFNNVDTGGKTLTVGNGSGLTVVGSITNGDPTKPITLDNGSLTLGVDGVASGGTVSTGITTTGTTGNQLNLGNGTYTVNGDITHAANGQLAVTVDKGTLNAGNVDATTLDVGTGGTLHSTGNITAGSLTDGISPTPNGVIDNGHIVADGNMTVTNNGVDAVHGATVTVAGTLDTGTGNVSANSGSTINAGTLATTGNVAADGTGSAVQVAHDFTASGTVTASNGGTVALGNDLNSTKAITADNGTVSVAHNLTQTGDAPLIADHGGTVSVGGILTTNGPVLADHNGNIAVTGAASVDGITAQNGGDISVGGALASTGPVTATGAGSTLTVGGALSAPLQDVTVSGGAQASLGSITAAKDIAVTGAGGTPSVPSTLTVHGDVTNNGNTLADGGKLILDTNGNLVTTGSLIATNNGLVQTAGNAQAAVVTASAGGDVVVGGTLTTAGYVAVSGAGSSLTAHDLVSGGAVSVTGAGASMTVTGAVTATGENISIAGGAQAALGSVAAAKDITVSGNDGASPATDSLLLVHGNVHNSGNTLADGGKLVLDNGSGGGNLTTTGSITATNNGLVQTAGNATTASVTANTGGDVVVGGVLTSSGPVLVTGAGSTLTAHDVVSSGPVSVTGAGAGLTVIGAVTATGQDVSVTNGATANLGSVADAKNLSVTGAGGTPSVASSLSVTDNATNTGTTLVDGGRLNVGGLLATTGTVTVDNGGVLAATGGLTTPATVSLNHGSTLTTGTGGAGGTLTAAGLTAAGASTANLGSAALSGPVALSGGSSLATSGNFSTTGTNQTVTVGTTTDTAGSTLNAATHTGGTPATYYVASGAAASPSQLRFGAVASPLNDTLIGGPNSVVALGPQPLSWATTQAAASGAGPTATLALSAPVTLGASAQILMGDKYTADGKWNGAATADNYGLALRGKALMLVDTASATPLLTLGSKNTVLVEPTASLRLYADGVRAGQAFPLVGGLAASNAVTQNGVGFLAQGAALSFASLTGTNPLVATDSVTLSGTQLVVNTRAVDARTVLPGISGSTADYLNNFAVTTGFDVNHPNSGARFISRAVDSRFGGADLSRSGKIIEGAHQIAATGGVHGATMGVLQSGVGAIVSRTAFSSPLVRPGGLVSVNLADVDGTTDNQNPTVNTAPVSDEETGLSGGSAGGSFPGDNMNLTRSGLALWAMPIFQTTSVNGMPAGNMNTGYNSSLGGMALGADYTFNHMLRLGAAFTMGGGYSQSNGDFAQTNNNFNFWGAHLYGGWTLQNFGITADVGYTSTYNKLNQNIDASMQMDNLKSDVNSSAWSGGLRGEYKIETSIMDIIPHVGVRYTGLDVDSHDIKSGSNTAFHVDKSHQDVWTFPVGVTFAKDIQTKSGWVFKPQVDLGITPAAGDVKSTTRTSIPGIDGATNLKTQVVDYMSYDAGIGFELQKGGLSFGLNYQIQASEHRTAQGVFGTVRYEF